MGHYEGDWTCKECGEAIPAGLDGVGVISGRGLAVCRECSINYLKQFVELAKDGSFDFLFDKPELPTVYAPSAWVLPAKTETKFTTTSTATSSDCDWYSVLPVDSKTI